MKAHLSIRQAAPSLAQNFFFLAAAFLPCLAATEARADSIGVNFTTTLAPTDSAGAPSFAQTHYNNVSAGASNLTLNDNSGAVTTATLTTSAGNAASFGTPSGPDELLNSGFHFVNGSAWSFTLNNIPYANYNLVVYDLGFTGDKQSITAAGQTFYTSSPNPTAAGYVDNNTATPFTYTLSTSSNQAAPTPLSDYVVFNSLSGASQTVNVQLISGVGYRIVSGFQVVQVPEPSTWMLSLAGVGFAFFRRRRLAGT